MIITIVIRMIITIIILYNNNNNSNNKNNNNKIDIYNIHYICTYSPNLQPSCQSASLLASRGSTFNWIISRGWPPIKAAWRKLDSKTRPCFSRNWRRNFHTCFGQRRHAARHFKPLVDSHATSNKTGHPLAALAALAALADKFCRWTQEKPFCLLDDAVHAVSSRSSSQNGKGKEWEEKEGVLCLWHLRFTSIYSVSMLLSISLTSLRLILARRSFSRLLTTNSQWGSSPWALIPQYSLGIARKTQRDPKRFKEHIASTQG